MKLDWDNTKKEILAAQNARPSDLYLLLSKMGLNKNIKIEEYI